MAFVNPESKLYENQYDALVMDTANNPYMAYSKRIMANKALNTTKKSIVGAINELVSEQSGLNNKTTATLKLMLLLLGDQVSDLELKNKFDSTGYENMTEAIVGVVEEQKNNTQSIKDLISTITKEVVFVYPKLTQSSVSIEQFVPFKGKITKVIARISTSENNLMALNGNINVVLQKGSHDDTMFENVQNIILNKDTTYQEYDLTNSVIDTSINNEVLKTSLITYPNLVKDLVIIAKIELEA